SDWILGSSPGRPVAVNLVERILPRGPLQVLHDTLAGDTKKKCAELAAIRLELFRLPDEQQKNLLHHLFRGPRRTCHAQGIAVERRLMLLVENKEGLFVSAHRPLEQRRLFLVDDSHHSGSTPRRSLMGIPAGREKSSRASADGRRSGKDD